MRYEAKTDIMEEIEQAKKTYPYRMTLTQKYAEIERVLSSKIGIHEKFILFQALQKIMIHDVDLLDD